MCNEVEMLGRSKSADVWYKTDPVIDHLKEEFEKPLNNEVKLLFENGFKADITVNNPQQQSKFWIEFFHGAENRIGFVELMPYYRFLKESTSKGYYPIPVMTVPIKGLAEELIEKAKLPMIRTDELSSKEELLDEIKLIMDKVDDGNPDEASHRFSLMLETFQNKYQKFLTR